MANNASSHPISDIPWDDARLFLAVAEAKSLSGAARALKLGQPTVSRRLADLEYRLGFALFRRHAGGAVPTSAGERLLPAARKMAEWAGELGRAAASGGSARPEGLVRVTAAPGVAYDFVTPFAAWLREKHPGLRVEVLASLQHLDLARGEAELALRVRPPSSADLALLATLEHGNAAFVSKALAAKLPRKVGFADVPWIGWAPPYEELPPNPQLAAVIPGFQPSFTADHFVIQLRALEEGLGAMILPDVRHRFTKPGALVKLPLELGPWSRGALHLVCAKSALAIPRVRVTAELLAEELRRTRSPAGP